MLATLLLDPSNLLCDALLDQNFDTVPEQNYNEQTAE